MSTDNILYFAYGSNMNFCQMKERCPTSQFICKAYLEGYKLVFDGFSQSWNGPVANVIESAEHNVEGGLFKITESDLKTLERKEGYPGTYDRKKLTVKDEMGNNFCALVYLRTGEELGQPPQSYLDTILKGSADRHFSERYINEFIKGERGENDRI